LESCLGGTMAATQVLSQTLTPSGSIPGITLFDAAGNALGTGTLDYVGATRSIRYKAPGESAYGEAVSLTTTRKYVVRGTSASSGYVVIDVTYAGLSSVTDYNITVTIANQVQLFLPDITKEEAYTGFAGEYHGFYLYNANTGTEGVKSLQVQVEVDTPGLDTLSVALDTNAASNGTAPTGDMGTIVNKTTAPTISGSWMPAGANTTAFDLQAGYRRGFWIRRVVPALTVDGTVANTFRLKLTSLT